MTRRDLAIWRAALHVGINAMFDYLEQHLPRPTKPRPPAAPDGPVTDEDRRLARKILDKHRR